MYINTHLHIGEINAMSSSAGSVCDPLHVSKTLLDVQDNVSVPTLSGEAEEPSTSPNNGPVIDYLNSTTPNYRYAAMHSFEWNVVLPLIGACE